MIRASWTEILEKYRYRIRLNAAPGFYFSFWVFGWGSIQIWPQKVDFWAKKWGCIQENPQKVDFSKTWGSIQEWGCIQADTVIKNIICIFINFEKKNDFLWYSEFYSCFDYIITKKWNFCFLVSQKKFKITTVCCIT